MMADSIEDARAALLLGIHSVEAMPTADEEWREIAAFEAAVRAQALAAAATERDAIGNDAMWLSLERERLQITLADAESQVKRLADFIMEHVPGEPSRSEGAVDVAIRLLADVQVLVEAARLARDTCRDEADDCVDVRGNPMAAGAPFRAAADALSAALAPFKEQP